MKLIDIDKVKAEIDERINSAKKASESANDLESQLYFAQQICLASLYDFLDTLSEEKQDDIEKEIEKCADDMPCDECTHESVLERQEEWLKEKLRYFYNRGLNSQQEDYPKVKGWVARDNFGTLSLYDGKPIKLGKGWIPTIGTHVYMDHVLFPEIKWEDEEPTEVELIIKKV